MSDEAVGAASLHSWDEQPVRELGSVYRVDGRALVEALRDQPLPEPLSYRFTPYRNGSRMISSMRS